MRWVLMIFAMVVGFVAVVVFIAARGAIQEAVAGTLLVTAAVLFVGACIVDAIVRHGSHAKEAQGEILVLMNSLDRRLRDALESPRDSR